MPHNNPFQPSTLVKAQATYYPHMISVFIPKTSFLRKPQTDPKTRHSTILNAEEDPFFKKKETDTERSIRRTKKHISDYALCNSFELFITFTFRENRHDITEKRKQMAEWLKNQRKRNGKFDYLIIPELHKDGALHFHALFYGYCGAIRQAVNPKNGHHVLDHGKPVYTLPEYTLGFTTAKNIACSAEHQMRVATYVKKYITKDMPTFQGKQRYWVSKDLKTPTIEDNPEPWYTVVKPDWQTETDNGKVLRFYVGKNPLVDMFWEAHQ